MKRWPLIVAASIAASASAWSAVDGRWGAAAVLIGAAATGIASLLLTPGSRRVSGTRTVQLAVDPRLLAIKRKSIAEELGLLEDAQDLQRSVFEVSAELVGCVDEADARLRFAAAMRRYWSCTAADLLVWERGTWRSLGGPANGAAPALASPVALPEEGTGDLVLDLSPGVDGQAALVLRGARLQPSLIGRSAADQRYVADVLRTQLALSLRRVILYADLQSLARLDPLTGTHRRWYGEARLREQVDAGEVVAVAMVDIDFFKRFNDDYGHAVGDQVLAAVGRELNAHLRTGDLVCRYGGEEFLVILPDTPPAGAMQVAERLRVAVAGIAGLPSQVTVSIGLACCHQDETFEKLVERADVALYAAKKAGRNRLLLAEDGAESFLRTTSRRTRQGAGTESAMYRAMAGEKPKPADE